MAKSRTLGTVSGFYTPYNPNTGATGSPVSLTKTVGREEVLVENTAGNHVTPNAFTMVRTRINGSIASGQYEASATSGRIVNGFPSTIYDRYGLSPPSLAVPNDLASKLFARANPFRPEILLPTFVFELRELPDLIRQLGRFNILKRIGKAPKPGDGRLSAQMWLSGNFGWAPLVSDLVGMLGFADSFSRRIKEFDAIYKRGGYTRKVKLYSGSGNPATLSSSNASMNIAGTGFNQTFTGIPVVDCWGTVRVRPKVPPSGIPGSQPPPQDVARAILGLNRGNIAANVWEALPWSWLVNWFVNVDDYIGAHSGGLDFTYEHACIMTHTSIEYTAPSKSTPADSHGRRITVSGGSLVAESKARSVVFNPPLPQFRMSLLSGHQLSILGALHVSRFKP